MTQEQQERWRLVKLPDGWWNYENDYEEIAFCQYEGTPQQRGRALAYLNDLEAELKTLRAQDRRGQKNVTVQLSTHKENPSMEPIHVHQWDYDGICEGCLVDIREALSAAEQQAQTYRTALEDLYAAYCAEMQSEHDYPGKPWTPDRDNDAAALKARAALNPQSAGTSDDLPR